MPTQLKKNIARVRNCPDITILNSLYSWSYSWSWCRSVKKCLELFSGHGHGRWSLVVGRWSLVVSCWSLVVGRWSLVIGCWSLVVGRWSMVVGRWSLVVGRWSMVMVMVRNVWSHSLSTLCVKILKWRSVTDSLTKVRYRAARAAKKLFWSRKPFDPQERFVTKF